MLSDVLSTKSTKNSALLVTLLALLLFSTESMAMFNYYIFSEVRGVVVSNGKPVAGAVLERTYDWTWKNQKGRDETVTNDKGEFHFPEITGFALLGWLPHEPVIEQTIRITYDAKSYVAWGHNKHNYDRNGELNGKTPMLYCALEAKDTIKESGSWGGAVTGICELR
jgi:hypothetical protein